MTRIGVGILAALAIAACGDNNVAARDAAPPDVAVDAAIGMASLTITNVGAPVPGVTVYFQNRDSSLGTMATTDATGLATGTLEGGGFVTALVPTGDPVGADSFLPVNLATFAGIKVGDQLTLSIGAAVPVIRNVMISAPLLAGAVHYKLFTTCGPGGLALTQGVTSATVLATFDTTCMTADVAVWASDTNNSVLQIAHATGVTIADPLDLTALTYDDPTQVTIKFNDVPTGVTPLIGAQRLMTAAGVLATPEAIDLAVSAGSASTLANQPALAGASLVTSIDTDFGIGSLGDQQIYDLEPLDTDYALDVGAHLLHEFSSQPSWHQPTHTVTWTEAGPGKSPDYVTSSLAIERGNNDWLWTIVAPDGGGSVAFPTLPVGTFDLNAGPADDTLVGEVEDALVPGGYDAVRAHAFDQVDEVTLLGTRGTATTQTLLLDIPRKLHRRLQHRFAFHRLN